MNKLYKILSKPTQAIGAICGGLLISLPLVPQATLAQQIQQPQQRANSQVNPCPSIFYDEPHNSRVLVPEGCPPNAITRQMTSQGSMPTGVVPANPTQEQIRMGVGGEAQYRNNQSYSNQQQRQTVTTPLLPEQQQAPIAAVTPLSGRVSVKLINDTNTAINYEVIGHTERRVLRGGEEVVLQNLPVPVTLSTVRQDNGSVKVIPVSTQPGMIELSLDESTNINNQGAIRIQQSGQIYLN